MKYKMKRRQFLSNLALLPLSLSASNVFSDSFDDFVKSHQVGVKKVKSDFQAYQEHYLDAFEQYKRKLETEWLTAELSNQQTWVEYSKNLKKKTVVDFSKNEIRLSYKTSSSVNEKYLFDSNGLNQDLKFLLNHSEYQAIVNDPINHINKLSSAQLKHHFKANNRILLSELNAYYGGIDNAAKTLTQVALTRTEETAKGQVITVTMLLPNQLLIKRAEKYYESAQKAAEKWNVDAALILAIAHTESHFNPLARNHIPAFGLMQIVPANAGKDVSKLMTGKSRILTSTELYDADFNLEIGSAYLNLLLFRYLKDITDPMSRLYCTIAAYNTGTGNVAKAFIGYASMQRAFSIINQLSSVRVYEILKRDLPYAETRRYLEDVKMHMENYQKIMG